MAGSLVEATTPTITLIFPDYVDLSAANKVYFTMRQGCTVINKILNTEDVIAVNKVEIYIPQEESIKMHKGFADIQLNWTYPPEANDGKVKRACSKVVTIPVTENLLKEVIK